MPFQVLNIMQEVVKMMYILVETDDTSGISSPLKTTNRIKVFFWSSNFFHNVIISLLLPLCVLQVKFTTPLVLDFTYIFFNFSSSFFLLLHLRTISYLVPQVVDFMCTIGKLLSLRPWYQARLVKKFLHVSYLLP